MIRDPARICARGLVPLAFGLALLAAPRLAEA